MNAKLSGSLSLVLLSAALACAEGKSGTSAQPTDAVADRSERASEERAVEVAQNGTSVQGVDSEAAGISGEDAKRLAQTHLALKKVSWGQPQEVVESENKYLVLYETPERELRLLGQRTLIVDRESGVVTYQKRR
ncbi:MAG: hypothetical protein KDD69_02260 [Bdellovibrionales bacterium]|nr:hypothetical protein [Bdellovibrionales bacterium]